MSALPFLIAGTAVIGVGLVAFVAAIWGAGEFTELDRPFPKRMPTQVDPDAEEDGEGHQ